MNEIFDAIWDRKVAFLSTFFLVFTVSYLILVAIDFVPEEPVGTMVEESLENEDEDVFKENLEAEGEESVVEDVVQTDVIESIQSENSEEFVSAASTERVLPARISISKLEREVLVLNPSSRNIADLDEALLEGVVRHPDSAALGEDGNVFILGHSSYLPVVLNKNFQAFNGIQDLAWGDTIELYADGVRYEYRVDNVYRAKAQDVTVPIAGNEKRLTLATCNSFGGVDDRYIVEAKQVDVQVI